MDPFRRDPGAYEQALVPVMFAPLAERLVALVDPQPGERVLDVCCGTGAVTRLLTDRVGPHGAVTGLDLSGPMLSVARQRVPDATFVEASAAELPFAEAAFDAATCQQGLQFVPEPVEALRQLRRVLTAGGRAGLALWAPIDTHLGFAVLRDALERRIGPDAVRVMDMPYRLADADVVRGLARDAGFDARVEVDDAELEWESCELFVRRFGQGSMLSEVFAAAAPETLEAVVHDVADAFRIDPSEPLRFGRSCFLYELTPAGHAEPARQRG